jgi:hypothetical protein
MDGSGKAILVIAIAAAAFGSLTTLFILSHAPCACFG